MKLVYVAIDVACFFYILDLLCIFFGFNKFLIRKFNCFSWHFFFKKLTNLIHLFLSKIGHDFRTRFDVLIALIAVLIFVLILILLLP